MSSSVSLDNRGCALLGVEFDVDVLVVLDPLTGEFLGLLGIYLRIILKGIVQRIWVFKRDGEFHGDVGKELWR